MYQAKGATNDSVVVVVCLVCGPMNGPTHLCTLCVTSRMRSTQCGDKTKRSSLFSLSDERFVADFLFPRMNVLKTRHT